MCLFVLQTIFHLQNLIVKQVMSILLPEYVSAPKIILLETQYDQVSQSDLEETLIVKDTNEAVFESGANSEHTNEFVKDDNYA